MVTSTRRADLFLEALHGLGRLWRLILSIHTPLPEHNSCQHLHVRQADTHHCIMHRVHVTLFDTASVTSASELVVVCFMV